MQIRILDGQSSPRATGAPVDDSSAGASRGPRATPSGSDEVTLAEWARGLAAAYHVVVGTPWVREEAVRSVRAALAGGCYAVDTRELAAAMSHELSS